MKEQSQFAPPPLKDEGQAIEPVAQSMDDDRRDEYTVAPRPWRVLVDNGRCDGIIDANGRSVVQTDSGFYPPNIATAQFIVDLANKVP